MQKSTKKSVHRIGISKHRRSSKEKCGKPIEDTDICGRHHQGWSTRQWTTTKQKRFWTLHKINEERQQWSGRFESSVKVFLWISQTREGCSQNWRTGSTYRVGSTILSPKRTSQTLTGKLYPQMSDIYSDYQKRCPQATPPQESLRERHDISTVFERDGRGYYSVPDRHLPEVLGHWSHTTGMDIIQCRLIPSRREKGWKRVTTSPSQ